MKHCIESADYDASPDMVTMENSRGSKRSTRKGIRVAQMRGRRTEGNARGVRGEIDDYSGQVIARASRGYIEQGENK